MRRVFLSFIILTVASLADAPQISFLVLNPLTSPPGHLPDGWQVKINRGEPEIATVQEGRDKYLDLKSHNSSYGLEHEVDVDPREAPGVGTPVEGGITYREAHLAMEMLGDTGRVTSMEVVEVNPVIDEANRTAILAVELVMSAMGKRIL